MNTTSGQVESQPTTEVEHADVCPQHPAHVGRAWSSGKPCTCEQVNICPAHQSPLPCRWCRLLGDALRGASNRSANPRTSCREVRAITGMDELIEDVGYGVVIVRAVKGIHAGCFILWRGDECAAIGSETWVRSRLETK